MNKIIKLSLTIPFVFLLLISYSNQVVAMQPKVIVITDMGIIPKELPVKRNRQTTLIIHNQSNLVYTVQIPALQSSSPYLMEGEMASLNIKPVKLGRFDILTKTSHAKNDFLKGVLIVTE